MTQFDVHRNVGKQRETIPYVVVIQSSLYDGYRRRVVVPLVLASYLDRAISSAHLPLNPVFTVESKKVVLHPLEVVSIATEIMGEKVTTLADEGDRIIAAMDELLTRAWA